MKPHERILPLVVVLVLTAGCAGTLREEPGYPQPASSPAVNSPAVVQLSSDANAALQAGRFDQAAQLLERAIRIEPRNGGLWYELARVRFEQGNYDQAMQLANRSNALPDTGAGLRSRNEELIRAARQALSY